MTWHHERQPSKNPWCSGEVRSIVHPSSFSGVGLIDTFMKEPMPAVECRLSHAILHRHSRADIRQLRPLSILHAPNPQTLYT